MKIAIVHYHLQPGGVTRIIQHQVAALAGKDVDLVVLAGKKPFAEFPWPLKIVDGLQYEDDRPTQTAASLLKEMLAAAKDALGTLPDLWHFHNHSLGKNMILPTVIRDLAGSGQHMLLQLHDFAEDGRPYNYRTMVREIGNGSTGKLSRVLYPKGDHVHYSVLNARDYRFLSRSDDTGENIHLLGNPVELNIAPEQAVSLDQVEDNLYLYPTRAIRRKNIGEFLLWAALADKEQTFATTLGPDNPREWKRYNRWRKVAAELDLPVEFELGAKRSLSFIELLQRAKVLVTTSIAEGFGMAFLEPWLAGRPVVGRNLAEITGDFFQSGICLPWNYNRLDIPVDWLGQQNIHNAAREGLEHSLKSYGRKAEPGDLERVLNRWIRKGMVDFGRLNEELQEKVLVHLTCNSLDKSAVQPQSLFNEEADERIIEKNCRALASQFSLDEYGHRLHALYSRIAGSDSSSISALNGERLLDLFLAPERLHLLQVE